jgi:hypothetical protein
MSRHPLTMTMGASEWRSAPMLEKIIEAYRENGDEQTRDQIIRKYITLVIGMAGNYARRLNRHQNLDVADRTDELASVGLTALTQAVVWCGPHLNANGEFEPSRLHDNNIEPYIKSTVRSWIRRAIAEDRVMKMPGRTYRKKIADEGEVPPQPCVPSTRCKRRSPSMGFTPSRWPSGSIPRWSLKRPSILQF